MKKEPCEKCGKDADFIGTTGNEWKYYCSKCYHIMFINDKEEGNADITQ